VVNKYNKKLVEANKHKKKEDDKMSDAKVMVIDILFALSPHFVSFRRCLFPSKIEEVV
jgi:hypothetical protein